MTTNTKRRTWAVFFTAHAVILCGLWPVLGGEPAVLLCLFLTGFSGGGLTWMGRGARR